VQARVREISLHGILAAQDKKLMAQTGEAEIVLELCPTSNLLTKALADEEAVRDTFRALSDHGVRFTIATDGPEMMRTHLPTSSSFCFGSAQLRRSSSGRQTGARMKRASFAAARLS
jgi:adenosine deaminase